MKIIITESQYNLLIENKKNQSLIDIIKEDGWESAAELVGGSENLKTLVEIKTPMDFLKLFNDLDVVGSEKKPNLTLFRYEKGNNVMVYDRKSDIVYINYDVIWSSLKKGFDLNYSEIQQLTKEWLSEVYNLRGVTPGQLMVKICHELSEVYNLRGVTPEFNLLSNRFLLSEVYNLRGVTPNHSIGNVQ